MKTATAIQRLAAAYSLEPTTISAPQRGYRNHSYALTLADGRQLGLIQYKRDPDILDRIRRANTAGEWAARADLPTRRPADPRILRITGRATTYVSLYNYLPGSTIPWEAYTRRHIKLLGLTMARLHQALATLPAPNPIQRHLASTELEAQVRRNQAYFSDLQVTRAVQAKLHLTVNAAWLNAQPALLHTIAALPAQQPLHLDLVRSNVLFGPAVPRTPLAEDNLAVTGILDFEKTAWGHPALDLARTLAFLLVDCRYKTPREVRKYFLQSGYIKRGSQPITIPPALLEQLVDHYLFYDFSKFLRHNPYESLRHNEHYRRTRALLTARQILVPDDKIDHKQKQSME